MQLQGYLYAAGSSRREPARLSVDPQGRVWCAQESLGYWQQLQVSDRIGSSARYLQLVDGRRFECRDNDTIDRLEQRFNPSPSGRWLATMESRLRYVLLALLITVAAGFGLFRYGIPVMAEQLARQLPEPMVRELGGSTLALLDRQLFKPSQLPAEQRQLLQTLMAELNGQLPEADYRLLLRDGGPLGANALALPSGELLITDQLVQLAEHPDELSGVLAHEIGHLQQRHLLRSLLQNSAMLVVLAAVTGDVSAAQGVLVGLPTFLVEQHYSRQFEFEADAFAKQLLLARGRDPARMGQLLVRLAEQQGGGQPDWLATHPSSAERLQRLQAQ
ncbi:M48 family metallopeptidase [Marinobacterium arenosum]|uniref:M48 family metallopeptidase n=1 Tax=Marinobacterium arenosum TaxID=2862496 RepID=UPI001C989C74|nr:M48 family metallopeptidase [Marinobacterium arenosum]MBY4676451.1 M48 family metallopeptidase [Marinobacterium arenosum]